MLRAEALTRETLEAALNAASKERGTEEGVFDVLNVSPSNLVAAKTISSGLKVMLYCDCRMEKPDGWYLTTKNLGMVDGLRK